jgi:hypothetical protein
LKNNFFLAKKICSDIIGGMSENITQNDNLVKAKEEIETILLKYNIVLVPVVVHRGDKTISRIDIAPASEEIQ